jgi:hypothetical protein
MFVSSASKWCAVAMPQQRVSQLRGVHHFHTTSDSGAIQFTYTGREKWSRRNARKTKLIQAMGHAQSSSRLAEAARHCASNNFTRWQKQCSQKTVHRCRPNITCCSRTTDARNI